MKDLRKKEMNREYSSGHGCLEENGYYILELCEGKIRKKWKKNHGLKTQITQTYGISKI